MKKLVHNYRELCDDRTKSNLWERIKSYFGYGKRAGLEEAKNLENEIKNEITSLENFNPNLALLDPNLEKIKDLPNFKIQAQVKTTEEAEESLIYHPTNSSIVWIKPDGKVVRTEQSFVERGIYKNEHSFKHTEYPNASAYLEYQEEMFSKSLIGGFKNADSPLIDASQEEIRANRQSRHYEEIMKLPENKLIKAGGKGFVGRFIDFKILQQETGNITQEAINFVLSTQKPTFRVFPRDIDNKQSVTGFQFLFISPSKQLDQPPIMLKYHVVPTADGFLTQDITNQDKEGNISISPEITYDSIEKFIESLGLDFKREHDLLKSPLNQPL